MINRMLGLAALILGGAAVLVPLKPGPDSAGGSGPVSPRHEAIEAESLAARRMESPIASPPPRDTVPRPVPDSTSAKKDSFDFGPGGCFY